MKCPTAAPAMARTNGVDGLASTEGFAFLPSEVGVELMTMVILCRDGQQEKFKIGKYVLLCRNLLLRIW